MDEALHCTSRGWHQVYRHHPSAIRFARSPVPASSPCPCWSSGCICRSAGRSRRADRRGRCVRVRSGAWTAQTPGPLSRSCAVSPSGVMEPPVSGILEPAATRLKGTIEAPMRAPSQRGPVDLNPAVRLGARWHGCRVGPAERPAGGGGDFVIVPSLSRYTNVAMPSIFATLLAGARATTNRSHQYPRSRATKFAHAEGKRRSYTDCSQS